MPNFIFDTRGLPTRFTDQATGGAAQQAYRDKVIAILAGTFGLTPAASLSSSGGGTLADDPAVAYIIGKLLLAEIFDENAPSFTESVGTAWNASLVKVTTVGKTPPDGTPLRQVLPNIVKTIDDNADPATKGSIFYQMLASVGDYIVANADSVPVGHPSFARQILIAVDRYISGPPPGDSLELPPLTGVGATDIEIEPENVKAVGVVYLALQMERMRLFHVVDRITYYFMQGLVALPFDAASRALDDYYWSSEDRLNEAARNMIYGRVLGAPGTEISKDVQPNKDWDSLLGRFIASVAEFDREQRLSDLFSGVPGARPSSASQENIRKNGRDLLQNASLYGWGGTQTSARRLKQHVIQALDILRLPQLQKIYGVTSPFQVIERVTMNEFGQAPNIVKYRTLAESGKNILNALARNFDKFALTTGGQLFTTLTVPGDISLQDTQIFVNESNAWLAVNAIGSEQTEKMSRLEDTKYSPSMPIGGAQPASPDLADKLQQMIKSGSAPSIDQLQSLLPSFK
jgi:hypothetical protein